jgi:putative MATE family efflux protein
MVSRRAPLFGPAAFYRESLGIVVPVMLQQAISALVSLVDNFMVAGLGDSKMAAVNVANQINFVYFVVVNVACMAGGIYLSQYRGAKDAEGMRQAFRFKLALSGIVSLAYLAICNLVPEALVAVMLGGNAEGAAIVAEGASYLRIVSLGFVPIGMSSAIGSAFRDIGEPVPPLLISSFAALVNTALNWVLIYGNLGAPRLEIAGAAIATDIARCCEFAVFLLWTRRCRPAFAFSPKSFFKIDRALFLSMLSRSGVMFFSETAWVLSETIITALYNGRGGAETVAGMAAGWTIANLIFLVFPGIHTATNVIVGSTLGAGRLEDARTRARWIMSGSVILGSAGTALAFASTLAIPFVFGNLSDTARMVTRGLVMAIGSYLPLWCLLNAQFAVSRAGGDTAMGVWVDVGVTYVAFIPAAFALAYGTTVGPVALFAIAKISDIPKAVVAAWWLRKERWVKNLAGRTS